MRRPLLRILIEDQNDFVGCNPAILPHPSSRHYGSFPLCPFHPTVMPPFSSLSPQERFIDELIQRQGLPPAHWRPRCLLARRQPLYELGTVVLEGGANSEEAVSEEEQRRRELLLQFKMMFPTALEVYLEEKAGEVARAPKQQGRRGEGWIGRSERGK